VASGVGREGAGQDDELGANQFQFTIRLRLIDQGLRFRGVANKLSIFPSARQNKKL
jgi:hypothetical protein